MRTCVRCGGEDLQVAWELRSHRLGRLLLSGSVPSLRCQACGARWPWAGGHPASAAGRWLVGQLSPALAYLQAEGDLIVVRWGEGLYEVVP